jgi:hypothetical protein
MSEGDAAIAALTERIKRETIKFQLIKALKFDISMTSVLQALVSFFLL